MGKGLFSVAGTSLNLPDVNFGDKQDEPEGSHSPAGQEVLSSEDELERLAQLLPPQERGQFISVLQATLSHSGPLPAPKTLAEYEAVLPGLAERIVRLPEREQEHRHEFSREWLRREARLKDRGQILGMVAMVIVLAFCLVLVLEGSPGTAGTVAVALVAAVVGIFVTGKIADARAAPEEPEQPDE